MNLPLTITDVIFAAGFAGVIVFIIRVAGRMFHALITRSTVFYLGAKALNPEQLEIVMQRCHRLFPVESLVWEGTTFKRGNVLRVVTDKDEAYEGKFMGTNDDNMVCLVTNDCVVAQQIDTITEIKNI